MSSYTPPANTPILVGAGQYVARDTASAETMLSPIALAALAAERALADCGARVPLAPAIDVLAVVRFFEHSVRDRVMWPNPFGGSDNVPWAVAGRLGATPRRALYAEVGGQTPQRLVNRMAEHIHAGEVKLAVLTGAEAIAAIREATRRNLALDWREQAEGEFEDCWPAYPMVSDYELRHGVALPIHVYALFEQARRHATGQSLADYRAAIGELFAPFSAVAAANPYAQFPRARTPAEIALPGGDNYLVCEPYTRWMVAQDAVNQGAAVVLTSVGAAREFGIPESQWVYLRAYADVDELQVSLRPSLAESPAQQLAIARALDTAGLALADLAHIDLYSCFPIAVTSACAALDLDPATTRAPTLTGGLPYCGGPGNNYSMHAIAEVMARLRAAPSTHGLVVANGGYLSKHSVGVYSGSLDEPWLPVSSADQQRAAKAGPAVELAEVAHGTGTIESYAAMYRKGQPAGGLIVARQADGRRCLALAHPDDAAVHERLFQDHVIGTPVKLSHADGVNHFTTA